MFENIKNKFTDRLFKRSGIYTKSKINQEKQVIVVTDLIDYYKSQLPVIIISIILIMIPLYIIYVYLIPQIWIVILGVSLIVFTFIKGQLSYMLKRRKDITTGFKLFMTRYATIMTHIPSFKEFVQQENITEYPELFRPELLIMKEKIKNMVSSDALQQFFEDPKNNYWEIKKYRDFSISAVISQDEEMMNTLIEYIKLGEDGKAVFKEKIKFIRFEIAFVMVFMIVMPLVFILIFEFFGINIPGIATTSLLPSPLFMDLWLSVATFTSSILIFAQYYAMYEEDKAVNKSYIVFILMIFVSLGIYAIIFA